MTNSMTQTAQSREEREMANLADVKDFLVNVRMEGNLLTVMAKDVVEVTQIIHIKNIITRGEIQNKKERLVLLEKTDHVVSTQKEQSTAHSVNLMTKAVDVNLNHVATLAMEIAHTVVLKTEIIFRLSKKTTKEDKKDNLKIVNSDHIADLMKTAKVAILNHVVRLIPKMENVVHSIEMENIARLIRRMVSAVRSIEMANVAFSIETTTVNIARSIEMENVDRLTEILMNIALLIQRTENVAHSTLSMVNVDHFIETTANVVRSVATMIDLVVAEIFVHQDLAILNHAQKPTKILPIL